MAELDSQPQRLGEPTPERLGQQIVPCGPVIDTDAAERVREAVRARAEARGVVAMLDRAWPALAPVAAASPYLGGLMRREPERLLDLLDADPEARLDAILDAAQALAASPDLEIVRRGLRRLKAELHLLTALADLGGVWRLDQVTGALTRFADTAVQTSLSAIALAEQARGRLLAPAGDEHGPIPGLFCLALGKHGALELNYSSDIDVSIFYAPEAFPSAPGVDVQGEAVRVTQMLAAVLQERTADGYVFRIDLRLRPDPSSTPPAMPIEAALNYYETAGQNWERAAMIKARVCGGDRAQGQAFLAELQPFIWRRSLDYAAIADIHAIKRQIHVHKVDERLSAPGHNLKLGAGGIREIEFFVQTQQLILGGRDRNLRARRTIDALNALAAAGHVTPEVAGQLADAYRQLRGWEHRVQMIADEQTHVLPEAPEPRRAVAALAGYADLGRFDNAVSAVLTRVNARYGELFAEDEPLSSSFGSLVFTGVEDDPETLDTIARMGFSNPAQVAAQIRGWHHGRIPATRTERGRELFTRLAPRLLEAAHATGAPDVAFTRFSDFFARLPSGVQVQSLFLAQPKLFELIVEVMAFAPQLAATLSRQPGALDALLDPGFFAPIEAGEREGGEGEAAEALARAIDRAEGFEAAMGAARRAHREQAFRIGVQVISGAADAEAAGRAFAALADACIAALGRKALIETTRIAGTFPGEVAVVALGKTGSREMTAGSDLDLMTLYASDDPAAASHGKGWGAETFYSRFTQRLITALSAPTADGGLYPVDLQLRPSGRAGPVAVSLAAFEHYYAREAETWEVMALTRARVVWASDEGFAARFGEQAARAIEAALRRPRDVARTARDALEMRALMMRERPARGPWDLKLGEGGLVDIEFAAQFLQLAHAADDGPLHANTCRALAALRGAGLADPARLDHLIDAWRLQQDLQQVLKLALQDAADPDHEPERFKALLARSGGAPTYAELQRRLARAQAAAHTAFVALVTPRAAKPRSDGRAGGGSG